jgi:hypothetical protein
MNSKPVITPGPRATTTLVARGLATPGDLRGGRAAESAALTRRHDILMTVKLKGRASAAQVADVVGFDASTLLDALAHDGLVEPVRSSFRITPAGAETVGRALEAIRAEIGDSELERSYARFCPTNDAFKQTVTDWQLRTVDGVHTLTTTPTSATTLRCSTASGSSTTTSARCSSGSRTRRAATAVIEIDSLRRWPC